MPKGSKIELRIEDAEKARIRDFAREAGYGEREVSIWIRRILTGEELHPVYEEVRGRKA